MNQLQEDYTKYATLVEAAAAKLGHKYHRSRDEFRGWLCLMLVRCRNAWKPGLGAEFSTYYWSAVMRDAYSQVVVPDKETQVWEYQKHNLHRPDYLREFLRRTPRAVCSPDTAHKLDGVGTINQRYVTLWHYVTFNLRKEAVRILHMKYQEGLKHREIADILGVTKQRVQQLCKEALEHVETRFRSLA